MNWVPWLQKTNRLVDECHRLRRAHVTDQALIADLERQLNVMLKQIDRHRKTEEQPK